jgi:1-deoxy-D-xylulose-5-phosphate reductoisomerase
MGTPDMRIPIGYCLAWPERMATPAAKLDLAKIGSLTFENPDLVKFPALRLAREAMQRGGTTPALLNAANEVSVEAFLAGRIGFLDIERINEGVMNKITTEPLNNLEILHAADAEARSVARKMVAVLPTCGGG